MFHVNFTKREEMGMVCNIVCGELSGAYCVVPSIQGVLEILLLGSQIINSREFFVLSIQVVNKLFARSTDN